MYEYAKSKQKQISKNAVQKKKSKSNSTDNSDRIITPYKSLSGFSFGNLCMHCNEREPNHSDNISKKNTSYNNSSPFSKINSFNETIQLVKNRTLTTSQKNHIFKGDKTTDKKPKPTGYHSKAGTSLTHEAFGDKESTGIKTYKQKVRFKQKPYTEKSERSTFFPDNATEQEVIEGIEGAPTFNTKGEAEIHSPSKLQGVFIRKSGDTIYPIRG